MRHARWRPTIRSAVCGRRRRQLRDHKIPIGLRNEDERARSSWTHANRLRRTISGSLGAREFVVVPPLVIDELLARRDITDLDKLNAIPPNDLGHWLNADTLVYGRLMGYEAYYAFLLAAWRVSATVRRVSAEDGHEIFSLPIPAMTLRSVR